MNKQLVAAILFVMVGTVAPLWAGVIPEVPEPSSLILLASGAAGAGYWGWTRIKNRRK